ncbi:MAG: hypothetical protein COW03_14310 [Cytophagales bacterium CG12_big_fil_rev_8_21_14_0_65_40_12]|nr:MAG: hypothetical protein COW03_14310 [Cytophagales bacterium CG12_big_fil_rev_8_21_14_0_65_40_12]PIW03166.1 MAG: hypothetical protein COW40_16370 [Cytophagales bacterium CG17_big_fil_post_rev_8_21_14_2_50_40_13]
MKRDYRKIWLAFVQIKAEHGYSFNELIDLEIEKSKEQEYIGAWANLLIKADSINDALKFISLGLNERNFETVFIDKIENLSSLVEYSEIDEKVIKEANWLIDSSYVFIISDKVFPYVE